MRTRLLVAFLLWSIACGTGSPAPTPPDPAPDPAPDTTPPADATGPELVVLEADPDPTDCVAAGPKSGLLDRKSATYKRIEITEGAQRIEEKATLATVDVTVTASIGGCAHFGASYTMSYKSDHPVTDAAHHYRAALEMMKALALRAGVESYRDGIEKGINQALADPALLETCVIAEGEMVNIHCGINQPSPGVVEVAFAYDIVL